MAIHLSKTLLVGLPNHFKLGNVHGIFGMYRLKFKYCYKPLGILSIFIYIVSKSKVMFELEYSIMSENIFTIFLRLINIFHLKLFNHANAK